ncbi:hypothetical protein V6N13_112595 [Hibiscus sabdariffa]|uniref:Uncharacterized protein n=1 Tax=Hibiscus sabdariffa TaxID=183260 RepID=A0ABR2TNN0_9ROSI
MFGNYGGPNLAVGSSDWSRSSTAKLLSATLHAANLTYMELLGLKGTQANGEPELVSLFICCYNYCVVHVQKAKKGLPLSFSKNSCPNIILQLRLPMGPLETTYRYHEGEKVLFEVGKKLVLVVGLVSFFLFHVQMEQCWAAHSQL